MRNVSVKMRLNEPVGESRVLMNGFAQHKRTRQLRNGLFFKKWFLNLLEIVISMKMKLNEPVGESRVHMNGFAQILVLTQKNKTTQKWSLLQKVVSGLAQNCDFNLHALKIVCSSIHTTGFNIFPPFLTFKCTEKERHADQSTKKKAPDHLFGFSGKFCTGIRL